MSFIAIAVLFGSYLIHERNPLLALCMLGVPIGHIIATS